jgi:glycine/D-amino acid oxidase-like deaminating enzyme
MNDYKIIGGGIQGCCIALELASRGQKVTLIERDSKLFNRASLRNEGKIHLGLVYMNDPTFETPALMLRGALLFRKYLERWIGEKSFNLGLSEPFYYLVAKDSFLNSDQLERGYQRLQLLFEEWKLAHPDWDYLGQRPGKLFDRKPEEEIQQLFGSEVVQGGFLTAELAINTDVLRSYLTEVIYRNENIEVFTDAQVTQIEQMDSGYQLSLTCKNENISLIGDSVINCAWDGKYVLDKQMGLPLPPELLHRLKYRVIVNLPDELKKRPSATMVIGKFGDVVNQRNDSAYLSWYPSACIGWSHEAAPPKDWELPARGEVSPALAEKLSVEFLTEIEKWYPGISKSTPILIDAGPIVAYGKTDVDDAKSSLHDRSGIGFKSLGGYHSIETGKLTTAPMIAVNFVDSIFE